MSVAWPTGVQLLVSFCSSVSVVLFDTPGISMCRSQQVLSSPHLCFIIVFICDLFVSRDNPLMSRKPSRGPNNSMFVAMTEAEGEVGIP